MDRDEKEKVEGCKEKKMINVVERWFLFLFPHLHVKELRKTIWDIYLKEVLKYCWVGKYNCALEVDLDHALDRRSTKLSGFKFLDSCLGLGQAQ